MDDRDRVRNFLALLEIKGIGPGAVKKNLDRIRSSKSDSEVFNAMALSIGDRADEEDWRSALAIADRHLEQCAKVDVAAISILDPQYPFPLMELSTPPPVIFCRGNLSLLSHPMLGMIGARKSTEFGETVAARIGRHFSEKNITLCNGLADGIDICSVTRDDDFLPRVTGVMACGLDLLEASISSKRIKDRASKLLKADGLLVSELPPGTEEDQNTVIASCRLQAGLSHVLLLVQSSSDGGSRFTVGHFCKLPRALAFVVPPDAQISVPAFGANFLLSQGIDGLVEFAGMKTSKTIRADLLPIRSRAEYDSILRHFDGSSAALL